MGFFKKLPIWKQGLKHPDDKQTVGQNADEMQPAEDNMGWLQNKTYEALKKLQGTATVTALLAETATKEELGDISKLGSNPRGVVDSLIERGINVLDYGLKGDETTSNDISIQNLFDSQTSNINLVFPAGIFILSKLTVENKSGITIKGVSKTESVLRITSNYNQLVQFKGCNNILFEDITIELTDNITATKIKFSESTTINGCSNIKFRNCNIKNKVNKKESSGTLNFWRNTYNVDFIDCDFEDVHYPILFDNNGVNVSRGYVRMQNCDIKGYTTERAKKAILFQGTGTRLNTHVFVQNNIFERFDYGVMNLYHVSAFTVTGNTINDCKALVDKDYIGTSPVETAICWLDTSGSTSIGNSVFSDNSFTNCVGICVYLEEVRNGIIRGNRFVDILGRPSGVKTYDGGTFQIISEGNHCIIAVGGVTDLQIVGNAFANVERVLLLCRRFAPVIIGGYNLERIQFINNKISCLEAAINIAERVTSVQVKGNIATGTNNSFPFIEYNKAATTQDLDYIAVDENTINGFSTVYKRPANYGNGQFLNNYFRGSGSFFECDFRTNYAVNNNIHATSETARTIINA